MSTSGARDAGQANGDRPGGARPGGAHPDASPRHPTRPDAALLAVVALGGVVGSLGRWAVGLALPASSGSFPWATFAVNVSGAFAMGLLLAHLADRPRPLVRPFVGVGLLGGWTTFSAIAVDAVALTSAGAGQVALASVTATFLVGVLAVPAGIAVGQRIWPRPEVRA